MGMLEREFYFNIAHTGMRNKIVYDLYVYEKYVHNL